MSRTIPRCRTRKVLVLGADSRVLLAMIRSLGRRNLRVHVGWCPAGSLALRSKYVTQVHEIPPFDPKSDAWKQSLVDLLRKHHFDMVIPCDNSARATLQRHRVEIESLAPIYLLSDHAFETTSDKVRCHELARSLGICVPRSCVATSSSSASSLSATLQLPVVVRPRFAASTSDVRKASTVEELAACLAALPSGEEVLVQEVFRGTGVGIQLLVDRGNVLAAFQHVSIHETVEGDSSYRRSVPLKPELYDAACRLMATLHYTGVATVELSMDAETGQWVFLAIRGGFCSSLPLAIAAGADLPYYLYQLWVEGRREFSSGYDGNVRCRNLLLDYRGLQARRREVSSLVSLGHMARDTVRLLTFRDHLDSFASDDLRPGLAEFGRVARIIGQALSGRFVPRPPVLGGWMRPATAACPLAVTQ